MTNTEIIARGARLTAATDAAVKAIAEGRDNVRILRFSTRDLTLPRPDWIDPAEIEYLVTADAEVADED